MSDHAAANMSFYTALNDFASANLPFSISCWVISSSETSSQYIGLEQSGSVRAYLGRFSGGFEGFNYADNAHAIVNINAGVPTAGTLRHLVATMDGSNLRLYLNGVLSAGPTSISTAVITPNRLSIGRYQYGVSENTNVPLSDCRIYNRALSAPEVWGMFDPATRWDLLFVPSSFRRFIAAAGGSLVTLAIGTVTGTGTPTLVRQPARIASATGTGTSAVVRQPNRSLSLVTGSGTASFIRQVQRVLSLLTATGTASLIRQAQRVFSATATGTPSISRTAQRSLSVIGTVTTTVIRLPKRIVATATASGSPTVSAVKLVLLTIATVTASATASVMRQAQRVLSATATATPTLAKLVSRTMSATASGTASVVRAVQRVLATVIATGTASARRIPARIISLVTATGSAIVTTLAIIGLALLPGSGERIRARTRGQVSADGRGTVDAKTRGKVG
jgi:hypothetical protein